MKFGTSLKFCVLGWLEAYTPAGSVIEVAQMSRQSLDAVYMFRSYPDALLCLSHPGIRATTIGGRWTAFCGTNIGNSEFTKLMAAMAAC